VQERFGLFVIIVLGENIVGSLYSDEKGDYSAAVYGASALGMFVFVSPLLR
jgi:low temperature requirement protein LtrA